MSFAFVEMKNNTYISPKLIINADNPKAMIFFFFLKSKYRKSVFYSYKPERLSELTGRSTNTVRKYVGWLIRKGYAAKRNGNLWLISTRKIKGNEKLVLIDSKAWTTWKQFENRVYAAIIKDNRKKQAFHYTMKGVVSGTLKEKISVHSLRRYSRTYGKDTKETEAMPPINSIRQIAQLFNRSQGWAQKMLSRLEKMKYIKRNQKIVSLNGYVPPKYCTGGGFAYYNQRRETTCIHHGTVITVNY